MAALRLDGGESNQRVVPSGCGPVVGGRSRSRQFSAAPRMSKNCQMGAVFIPRSRLRDEDNQAIDITIIVNRNSKFTVECFYQTYWYDYIRSTPYSSYEVCESAVYVHYIVYCHERMLPYSKLLYMQQ
jgi:hypothetical protein